MDLSLHRSSDLRMCGSWNIAQILLFFDDLLMLYQAFGVHMSFNRCGRFVAGGVECLLRTVFLKGHIQ